MDIDNPPLSSPAPSSTPASDRRKSGRQTRRPALFSQTVENSEENGAGGKRKRGEPRGEGDEDASSDSDGDGDAGDETDEEVLKERRAARRAGAKKPKTKSKAKGSRASKKPKVASNGLGRQLAFRPATNGRLPAVRPRKPKVRPSLAAGERGLFAEVFGKGGNADTVAAQWLSRYQRNKPEALRDLVNFVLRCTGTELEIDTDEVKDVDNAPRRIGDLQNLYQAEGIVDYPLISKAKKFKAFSVLLEEFTAALIKTFHASSILYTDDALLENIQIWISTLSTSNCRPFRHTATIISLSIMNALCDIAREVTTSVSTSRKQLESEKKKKTVNKGRVQAIQTAVTEGEQKVERLDEFLQDGFDTVFVHRYRDIDGQIRAECLTALGGWIRTYREMFFEGQYLRYLGWTLADVVAQTRIVALTELLSLYENRDNIVGLHSFTERFRQRIVEIAVQDADVTVRMTAIELLNHLREGGLLEPNDIDAVGRLVFDLDPRIRKTAGRFFVSNVQDAYDAATEEVGEEINELLAEDDDEDDYESPKHSWIKYKCLADLFQAYDAQETEQQPEPISRGTLLGVAVESRFALATEAIFPHMEELAHWPSLAGYLLYDHSQIADEPSEDDTAAIVKNLYKMQEGHESILLEVLCAAVKLRVLDVAKSDSDKRGRKTKALTAKTSELQEEISHNLAQIIPQLLNKFGSTPETASVVLRLEHLVNLDTIQDLQKDATAYTSLLNDINKQFLTHSDQDVLAEASVAFLHAKSSEEMREALETKIQELWDDIIETLGALSQKKEVQEGSSLFDPTLTDLANTVSRISNLAGITNCTAILEAVPNSRSKSKKDHIEAPFNILIRLAERGLLPEDDDEETAKAETELVSNSIRTLLFYFMWKVQTLSTALTEGKASFTTSYFEALTKSRETFASTLVNIMQNRSGLDDLRFTAITTYLDLQTLFSTLRNKSQDNTPTNEADDDDDDTLFQIQSLIHEISPETQTLITKIHSIAERTYAKKARLNLDLADDDDAPASEDDLQDSEDEESDSDDENESLTNHRLRSSITAEQRLCEVTGKLVLAIIARVIDASGSNRGSLKKRLLRHKTALGHNYREVLSYLEEKKPRPSRAKGKQGAKGSNAKAENANAKSTELVVEDEEEEEEQPEAVEEDEDEDLRARGLVEVVIENGEEREEREEEATTPAPEADEDEIMGD
ncbi:hypothetical protein N7535_009160 [Penicillium sp. DV-2018c]|nr:hypothetical protein N7535_009160 [Penicillium sp. DV-2018c]